MRTRNKEKLQWIFAAVLSVLVALLWVVRVFDFELHWALEWILLSFNISTTLIIALYVIEIIDDIVYHKQEIKRLKKNEEQKKQRFNNIYNSLPSDYTTSQKSSITRTKILEEDRKANIDAILIDKTQSLKYIKEYQEQIKTYDEQLKVLGYVEELK